MSFEGVVFDWGGTLTKPIEVIYDLDTWSEAANLLDPTRVEELVERLGRIEGQLWEMSRTTQKSAHLSGLLASAVQELGLEVTESILEEAVLLHLGTITPHIEHEADARSALEELRADGLKIALLSNTLWPESFHEEMLARDGLTDLIDARLYTSHMEWTKPHPKAFLAALGAIGIVDPARAVFVGDRPWDDIFGAQRAGLRTVLRPNALVPAHDVQPDAAISSLSELPEIIRAWDREIDSDA